MTEYFKLADKIVSVSSDYKIESDGFFKSFLTDGLEKPFFSYNVSVGDVEEPCGKVVHSSMYCRTIENNGIINRLYYESRSMELYALTKEYGNSMDIIIDRKYSSKWGGSMNQIINIMMFPHVMLKCSAVVFHSSYILTEKGAVIFAGSKGIGKSTQANLWTKYAKADIINGDRSLLYFKDGQLVASGLPLSGSSDFCKNVTTPVAAIVLLGQSEKNEIKSLQPSEAVSKLISCTYVTSDSINDFDNLVDFFNKVYCEIPVCIYNCRRDRSAVERLAAELEIEVNS